MNRREASARPRILRPWQIVLLIAGSLLSAGAIVAARWPKAEVQVVSPAYEDIATAKTTSGTVLPVDDFPARANFTGLVNAVYVRLGQKVRAGQMLVRMKDQYALPRVEKAKADLQEDKVNEENVLAGGSQEDRIASQPELVRAQTEESNATTALNAMEQIAKNGSVTKAELEAAKQRLSIATANLASLKKRLTERYSATDIQSWKDKVRADRATVAAEEVSWENANIATPIAGTVYLLSTKLYDFVPAGTDLLHVADLDKLQVRADFAEIDLEELHAGMPVDVTWDGRPGKTWHGHIATPPLAVSRSGDRNVGECTIALDGDPRDLPVNTNVSVMAITARHTHVLTIPREALRTEGSTHFVYRVENGRLKRTPVETGILDPMRVEIQSGLNPEDTVALHAIHNAKLSDNVSVSITR